MRSTIKDILLSHCVDKSIQFRRCRGDGRGDRRPPVDAAAGGCCCERRFLVGDLGMTLEVFSWMSCGGGTAANFESCSFSRAAKTSDIRGRSLASLPTHCCARLPSSFAPFFGYLPSSLVSMIRYSFRLSPR